MDALECYRKADECLKRARKAPTQFYQSEWLKLAASWTEQGDRLRDKQEKPRKEGVTFQTYR